MSRARFRWTAEIDARVLALGWGEQGVLAKELGITTLSVRSRKKRLLQMMDGRERVMARERQEKSSRIDVVLYRRRMPGWLLAPVDNSV